MERFECMFVNILERAHTCTHPPTHKHTNTQTHTHAHTHTHTGYRHVALHDVSNGAIRYAGVLAKFAIEYI